MLNLRRRAGPYAEIARSVWQNRDRPGYSWRILRDGVCDGCALGTSGLRDWTIPGIHLCWIRLNLLRLNTMPVMDPACLAEASRLVDLPEAELRQLGRLPAPLIRERGEPGFRPIPWVEALESIAARLRGIDPEQLAFYLVSRGTLNETYYVAQKVARRLGTNNIDNSARICHAPSTVALKQSLGLAATTCSYRDLFESNLVVLFGSDVANNQPVFVKYLHLARRRGTRVLVVNPVREPGLERYWVPSNLDSALLGTRIADDFFQVKVGGDIAFINGVLKWLIADGLIADDFIRDHTRGWTDLEAVLAEQPFDELEALSGLSRGSMRRFAQRYAAADSAILVWSMGLTQHAHGVDNVKAIANLSLARANVGRPGAGLMPIRGHSGVQGGAEMGCAPNLLPGGVPLAEPTQLRRIASEWGFEPPATRGLFAAEMLEQAAAGRLQVLYSVGGNLPAVLPDSSRARAALEAIPLRVHHDIVFNPQMLVPPAETVLLLPATTRYEVVGGGTETSTERRVIFSPEIPGPRVRLARDEWRVLTDIAARVDPALGSDIGFESTAAIREEIARVIPSYAGIERLRRKGDQFQWGGPRLANDFRFGHADSRARIFALQPPDNRPPPGHFKLNTRRGKQFNSMIFGERDMLTGAARDTVLMNAADADALELSEGASVKIVSQVGTLRARLQIASVAAGTVTLFWPEANCLIPADGRDPECGIPAYRAASVRVEPL